MEKQKILAFLTNELSNFTHNALAADVPPGVLQRLLSARLKEIDEAMEDLVADIREYEVRLTAAGGNKIGVIKAIRDILSCGLKEAKDLADRAHEQTPSSILRTPSAAVAESAANQLRAVGGAVQTFRVVPKGPTNANNFAAPVPTFSIPKEGA